MHDGTVPYVAPHVSLGVHIIVPCLVYPPLVAQLIYGHTSQHVYPYDYSRISPPEGKSFLYLAGTIPIIRSLTLQTDGFHNLTLTESPIPQLKATEVLVKVHAVSLNYRDLVVAKGTYPLELKQNVVPCSDLAGEIVALGVDVAGWRVGDRVCSAASMDYAFGDVTKEAVAATLGGVIDGTLTEYKVLPAHVLVHIPEHLSYEEASTLPYVQHLQRQGSLVVCRD